MLKDIVVRKATLDDLPTLQKFEQALIRAERPFDPTIREDPLKYYSLEKILTDKNAVVYVAEHLSEIVSCGSVTIREARPYLDHEEFANFGFMFTLKKYRGFGINGMIMENCKEWTSLKGFKEMRLTVYTENQSAIAAYEKVGFKRHLIQMRMPSK
ncbi:GNAT family N-acetyltransferase [Eudoraea chungangensis]|uniref:GNAT family N-acetyltransferase n=1 Tax=Eudoraea chungangensis TaxID=1481905 RepID=UPI0023EBF537|nr:GNAT family N-acetyltransferase [Eudoraea chungangensis]